MTDTPYPTVPPRRRSSPMTQVQTHHALPVDTAVTVIRPEPSAPRDPSVPESGRVEWQRISLFLGGVVFAIGNLLHPLEHNDAAFTSPTWQAAHLTIFFSIPLLVLGLTYLHRQLTTRVPPRLATIAV